MPNTRPLIGITADLVERSPGTWSISLAESYADHVARAGAIPVVLPPIPDLVPAHAAAVDGVVFTGGSDPDMTQWGVPVHPRASLMHPTRQRYETLLLAYLREQTPDVPVLGICLGMQLMCLDAGGTINQHLPESCPTAHRHRAAVHPVSPEQDAPAWLPPGEVASNHHQGVVDPGHELRIAARGDDGVIEAVLSRARPFYVGVQWHPERTADPRLGLGVFKALVRAAT